MYPVAVLIKKTPFVDDEYLQVVNFLRQDKDLKLVFPDNPDRQPLPYRRFGELILAQDKNAYIRNYEYNITAVTDDSPFFFFTQRPSAMWHAGIRSMYWNLGITTLLLLLVISIFAVGVFLILPMLVRTGGRADAVGLGYFIMVGMGYILVEISLIQRFVLFLGHPTYAVTVVIFLMLLGSGTGSFVSRRFIVRESALKTLLAILVFGISVYLFLVPLLLSRIVGIPFPAKLVVSFILLAPLAFAMGMPFPAGLRTLQERASNSIEWAWAVNAASSVLGSVIAMVTAIQFGLTAALATGAISYLAALYFSQKLTYSPPQLQQVQ